MIKALQHLYLAPEIRLITLDFLLRDHLQCNFLRKLLHLILPHGDGDCPCLVPELATDKSE
jgi:hypothetical protein